VSASIESGPTVLGIHEHLLASIPGVLLLLDDRGIVRFASGQLEHLGGRPVDVLVGSEFGGYLEPRHRPLLAGLLATAAGRSPEQLTGPVRLPYLHADGTARLAEVWALNRLEDPALGGFVVLLLLESAYDHFDQVLASAQAGAALEDSLSALAEALRLPPVLGECFFVVASQDGRAINRYPLRPSIPGPPADGPWDNAMRLDSGELYTELEDLPDATRAAAESAGLRSVSSFPILTRGERSQSACLEVWSHDLGPLATNERTAVDRALILASLMISHHAAEERLLEAEFQDLLTSLGNRRSFFLALDARVDAGDRPALLYIDVDDFRHVNERLGHLGGDSALRVIARRLSSVVRPTDELARIGGDEFAILCAGEVTELQLVAIAARVVERLDEPLTIGDAPALKVGASVGIVFDFPSGTTSDALLAGADQALCEAKAAGRGCWRIAAIPERQR
jgi:diguanylate cyclase (GGDEF)-like protein